MRREREAVQNAISEIVGEAEAERLMDLSETLREVEYRPQKPVTPVERALLLMETEEGRAKLRALTWETV